MWEFAWLRINDVITLEKVVDDDGFGVIWIQTIVIDPGSEDLSEWCVWFLDPYNQKWISCGDNV